MAVILLALDESGKLDNSEDLVFGGCMFENAESHRFGKKWNPRRVSQVTIIQNRDYLKSRGQDFKRGSLMPSRSAASISFLEGPGGKEFTRGSVIFKSSPDPTSGREAVPLKSFFIRFP